MLELAQYQVGATVNVRYDPAKPAKVAIAGPVLGVLGRQPVIQIYNAGPAQSWPGYGQASGFGGVPADFAAIEGLNQRLAVAGVTASATILQSWPLAGTSSPNQVGMGFVLQVQPDQRPPFQAQAQGFIPVQAVGEYQPGHVIRVKYDPNNVSQVALFSDSAR
jgi:hypothetical protein